MDELLELLKTANGMSPLGVIALLAVIIGMLVKGQKSMAAKVDTLGDNHLHDLPVLVGNSNKMVDTLQRIEVKLS